MITMYYMFIYTIAKVGNFKVKCYIGFGTLYSLFALLAFSIHFLCFKAKKQHFGYSVVTNSDV